MVEECKSDYEKLEAQENGRRLLRQEEFILDVTTQLAEALERKAMQRSRLATLIRRSKSFVSQILAGNRNLTLRTIADVADALGYEPQLRLMDVKRHQKVGECRILDHRWRSQSEWPQQQWETSTESPVAIGA